MADYSDSLRTRVTELSASFEHGAKSLSEAAAPGTTPEVALTRVLAVEKDLRQSLMEFETLAKEARMHQALLSTLNQIANPNDSDQIYAKRNAEFHSSFSHLMKVANGETPPSSKEEEVFKTKGPIKECADLERFETSDFLGVWGNNLACLDRLEALLRYGAPRSRLKDQNTLSTLLFNLRIKAS